MSWMPAGKVIFPLRVTSAPCVKTVTSVGTILATMVSAKTKDERRRDRKQKGDEAHFGKYL
jgi:hypothetical protein